MLVPADAARPGDARSGARRNGAIVRRIGIADPSAGAPAGLAAVGDRRPATRRGPGDSGLINVKMLLGTVGLGALLRRYGARFDAAGVYGVLIVLVALALAGSQLLHLAHKRLDPSAS